MITVLEFAGSAVVGVLYVAILVAMVTRRTPRTPSATTPESAQQPSHLDPAA